MADIKEIAEQLVNLTIKEAKELETVLKEEYGIEPAAAAVAVAPGAAGDAPAEAEKTDFDVTLKEIGGAKLKVIKKLREITGLGLKEAKDIADNVPSKLKEGVPKDEAESIKAQLEEEGAVVELS